MSSKNHYKLIKLFTKERFFKVHNFKKDQIEVYTLAFKPKRSSKPFASQTIPNKTKNFHRSPSQDSLYYQNKKQKNIFLFKTLFSLYKKYKKYSFLPKNDFFFNHIRSKFLKHYGDRRALTRQGFSANYNSLLSSKFFSNAKLNPTIISVHITLRRNNIFVTLMKNNSSVLKVLSSGLFDIEKSERKRSPAYFTVIKKTLYFLRPYIQASRSKYIFRVAFKGFKRFRRPLINRFLFNKGFQSKCIGICNLDFEPFNGCRKRKSKRIKIKNKRKKNI
jgi:ribosomal protein S11